MLIILSPAKKMKVDVDSLPWLQLPDFLPESQLLEAALREKSEAELQALWNCNDSILKQNVERLHARRSPERTPAILAFEGIQYQYMAPGVMNREQLDYLEAHVRILSGFYGLLRPFDGVVPYRLELQAKLAVGPYPNLYAFWGEKLAQKLGAEARVLLNLASKEYSKGVLPHLLPDIQVFTCTFAQWKEGKLVEKGTLCKMARGQMVRWMAQNGVTHPSQCKAFRDLGYGFQPAYSTETQFVFVQEKE